MSAINLSLSVYLKNSAVRLQLAHGVKRQALTKAEEKRRSADNSLSGLFPFMMTKDLRRQEFQIGSDHSA